MASAPDVAGPAVAFYTADVHEGLQVRFSGTTPPRVDISCCVDSSLSTPQATRHNQNDTRNAARCNTDIDDSRRSEHNESAICDRAPATASPTFSATFVVVSRAIQLRTGVQPDQHAEYMRRDARRMFDHAHADCAAHLNDWVRLYSNFVKILTNFRRCNLARCPCFSWCA